MATSCSNMSRRHVAATNRFVCTGEFLWKSLSLHNLSWILSQQHVAKNQIRQNLCDLGRQQNSVAETNIFTKFLQYTQSNLSLRYLNLLLQLVARPVHTEWSVAVNCCCNLLPSVYWPLRLTTLPGSTFPTLNEQQCGFLFVPQEYLLHVQWNLVNTDTKEIINNYSSSPNGLRVNSPWGRRLNGLLTQRPWGREE